MIGENLAWGTSTLSTPEAIVTAWIASPGHLANILEARVPRNGHRRHARGAARSLAEGAPGATYTQEFGVIIELSARALAGQRSSSGSLLCADQRKEVVRTLSDSFCGTLEVTGR